jgi:hypothetical protein
LVLSTCQGLPGFSKYGRGWDANPAKLVTPIVGYAVAKSVQDDERRETMIDHKTGTREEWLAIRLDLLKAKKEYSRQGNELARRRQQLPWVRINSAA